MKRVFSVCMTLWLCLAALGARAEEPVVVRVGETAYPLSVVQQYLNETAQAYIDEGITFDSEDIENLKQNVIEGFVAQGVVKNKCEELMLDQLTEDEEKDIQTLADAYYEQVTAWYVEQIAEKYGKSAQEAERYAPTLMELEGITTDYAYEKAKSAYMDQKVLLYVAGGLTLSEEEVKAFYRDKYVRVSRDAYENDISAYEYNVLYLGGNSYYTPYGYRAVEHILFELDDTLYEALAASSKAMLEAEQTLQEAQLALNNARFSSNGCETEQKAFDESEKAADALRAEREALEARVLAAAEKDMKAVTDALARGESFEALAKTYSADKDMPEGGYMVHRRSILWTDVFRDGAMALGKPGDVSAPIVSDAGVHILRYVDDVEGGEIPLEGELLQNIREEALESAREKALQMQIEDWKPEYEIETKPELLQTPSVLQ